MPARTLGSRRSAPTDEMSLDEDESLQMQDDGGEEDHGDLSAREEALRNRMATDVAIRKGRRQQGLEADFDNEVHKLSDQIDKRVKEHRDQTKRTQDDFVKRLLALIQRKISVEKQIVQHVQELAEAHEAVKREFATVLKGRSEDVQEALDTLSEMQADSKASPGAGDHL